MDLVVLFSQTITILDFREGKDPPEQTNQRDSTYPNRIKQLKPSLLQAVSLLDQLGWVVV